MKAIFDKHNKLCVGVIEYCPDGQEAGLVGRKQEDVIVSKVPAELAEAIMNTARKESFRNLRLGGQNQVLLSAENQPEVLQIITKQEEDMTFILNKKNKLEERFERLLKYVLKSYIKTYNKIENGKNTDTVRPERHSKLEQPESKKS